MGQKILPIPSHPPRFLVAVGSETTRISLEAQLTCLPAGTGNYVVAVGTQAVLDVPKEKRGEFVLAEYGNSRLDLATILNYLHLPLVLVSYGSERIAEPHLDITQSSAVCSYHLNPTANELRVAITNAQRFYLMMKRIERDADFLNMYHG